MVNPQAHNGQMAGAAPAAKYASIPPGPLGQRMQKATDSLSSIRTSAAGWATTISAFVGISTVLGLLKEVMPLRNSVYAPKPFLVSRSFSLSYWLLHQSFLLP